MAVSPAGEWVTHVGGLELNKTYVLRVKARNDLGWSRWSEKSTVRLACEGGPEVGGGGGPDASGASAMRATTAQPVRSSSAAGLPQPSVVELADEAVTEGPSGSRARVRLTWGLGADAEDSGKRTIMAQGLAVLLLIRSAQLSNDRWIWGCVAPISSAQQ